MTIDPPPLDRDGLPAGAVFGDYRIHRLLGRGGMGAVYEAEHVADGRVVALKVLSANLELREARDRFLREGRSAAAVNHPNMVYVYGTEEIGGVPAISMELVADGTLEQRVRSRGPLPVDEVVEYADQMIAGLAAAHDVGLLHRDVKPSNCFVAADGTLKVGDFGLSKPIEAEEQLRLTQTGMFLGTPVFSSPEQLLGEQLDVRSDIYAVGLTLYFALTGELPFPSGSMVQVVATVLHGAPTPIAAYRKDVPPAVTEVVMKALARQPADRFQDYDEFRAAVAALRAPNVVAASAAERLRAWLVDALVVSVLGLGVYAPIQSARGIDPWATAVGVDLVGTFSVLVAALFVVALPEALRGASLGKWLFGIQVVRPDGRLPGPARAGARTLLLWSCYPVADVAEWLVGAEWASHTTAMLVRLAMLATARHANGWQTVYDRLTHTRVVRRLAEPRRRRASTRRSEPADDAPGARVGPYRVIPGVEAGGGCTTGWDAALQRYVWIAMRAPDEPAISEARRALVRVTRLRWVGSGTADGARWDAYSAPDGEPFLRRIERPVSWAALQGWITDLADELAAAEQDGTLPVVPSVDALWVGANDGMLITDVVPEPADPTRAGRTARDLIAELIARVRRSGALPGPLPPFATRALEAAAAAPHPRAARDAIAAPADRPTEVSRRQRTWILGVQLVPALVFAVLTTLVWRQQMMADRAGVQLDALLDYMGRERRDSSASYEIGRRVGALVGRRTPQDRADAARRRGAPQPHERRLVAVYIATNLMDRARDTTDGSGLVSTADRAHALRLVRELPAWGDADARAARVMVDSVWRGMPPGARGPAARVWMVAAAATCMLGAGIAVITLVLTVFLRRGLLLRLFDLELVTADGRPAGRMRVLGRQAATLVPALAALGVVGMLVTLGNMERRVVGMPVIVGILLLWAAWIWSAIRTPARSIADRIAGTYLTPG